MYKVLCIQFDEQKKYSPCPHGKTDISVNKPRQYCKLDVCNGGQIQAQGEKNNGVAVISKCLSVEMKEPVIQKVEKECYRQKELKRP